MDNNTIQVDGHTITVDEVRGNTIRGHTADHPCYVVTEGDVQAYGRTERSAELYLQMKQFQSKTEEERIQEFVSTYGPNDVHTAEDWVEAFIRLSGACYRGSMHWLRDNNIPRYERHTTLEVLDAIENQYGGDLITKVKRYYGGNEK